MSFSPGAYLEAIRRSARGPAPRARRATLCWCGSGRCRGRARRLVAGRASGHRAVDRQQRDEIAAAFARLVSTTGPAAPVEETDHRHLGGSAGRVNAQVGALLGPSMSEIGMGQRLGASWNNSTISPARACSFSSRRRRPARSTATASWRPFSVCRGRRQRKPLLAQHAREP